jgi:hypothetical protein
VKTTATIELDREKRASMFAALLLTVCAFLCSAQTPVEDTSYTAVERGPFYRVLQRTVSVTNNATGQVSQQVQSYTDLGNGMNYLSNGQWVASQDLIVATPTGAVATEGRMTASFSSDITSADAITLSTSNEVLQFSPIGLYYADPVSGQVAQIAPVQAAQGMLFGLALYLQTQRAAVSVAMSSSDSRARCSRLHLQGARL